VSAADVPARSRCDRCTAAGVRGGLPVETTAPFWDPTYRLCRPCRLAVDVLLEATATLPQPEGDGWRFIDSPAHSGAPHFLWRPDIRGLAAQIGESR
jgi:hypothetical protein